MTTSDVRRAELTAPMKHRESCMAGEMRMFIGIDFSGDHRSWGAGCRRANVWISEVTSQRGVLSLVNVRPVQELPGDAPPFQRLVNWLRTTEFEAAAIDAPFSVPGQFVPEGSHGRLVEQIASLPVGRRPFARGVDMIELLAPGMSARGTKVYRATETLWRKRNLNVRSTMWVGPRGGAPFTVSCITLLHRAALPIWPWQRGGKLLVEAYPAAQLRAWSLPCDQYGGRDADSRKRRYAIVGRLKEQHGLEIPERLQERLEDSADALDSVISSFAASAVVEGQLSSQPESISESEGWIAVHNLNRPDSLPG